MGKPFNRVTTELREFILAQRMFFVATAPLSSDGHVNVSPKGLDTFRVLDDRRVAYLDLIGSGNETSAHVDENGRITFMFCSMEGPPKIVRLYGRGRVILPSSDEWAKLRSGFPDMVGVRQIIVADIDRVGSSCGFGVPRFAYVEERTELPRYYEKRGVEGMQQYQRQKNTRTIDGMITPIGKSSQM